MRRRATVLLVPLAAASLLAACSSSSPDKSHDTRAKDSARPAALVPPPAGIAGPRRVDSSGAFAARAVEKVYGRYVKPGQRVVIGAVCVRGRCVVRYRAEARGEGLLLSNQQPILRALFARRSVLTVILFVHHWSTGTPTKNEAPVFATTVCRRREHPHFDWAHISSGDIARVCHFSHEAGGQLRSQVRRGLLSNGQASRGGGGNGNGQGQGAGNGQGAGDGQGGGNGQGAGNPNQ
jgi:hypothetical protein